MHPSRGLGETKGKGVDPGGIEGVARETVGVDERVVALPPRVRSRPLIFAVGCCVMALGLGLQVLDFVSMGDHHQVSAMGMSSAMLVGMGLVFAGMAAASLALFVRKPALHTVAVRRAPSTGLMISVVTLAYVIDVM